MTEQFTDIHGWDGWARIMEKARRDGIDCPKHGRQPAEFILTTAGLAPICAECEKHYFAPSSPSPDHN